MIMQQITLDEKRFDTNPKRLYFGPKRSKVMKNLEDYFKEFSPEEIASIDTTDHYCMAWMYIDDLKKTDQIFDQTGIRPENNSDVGVIPIEENGWKIGKKYDWAIMVIVNPNGELIGIRNGRRRIFNVMDLDEDWIPVNVRVDYGNSTSPVMDKILTGSQTNSGTSKKVRDMETVITNGVVIINADEGVYERTITSIEKLVKTPYPAGLGVYQDFSDRNSMPTRIINAIWNRSADSDDLTRIMDDDAWGEWYADTQMAKVHSLNEVNILCTDGIAYEGALNVHILKEGRRRKPWVLYSKKDTPKKAVKSVSEFKEKLEARLKDAVQLMIELRVIKDQKDQFNDARLPESGLRPWNILGVMPLLNSGKYKKYYENGMLIPETEFLQFNTTNVFDICVEDTKIIDEVILGDAA